MSLVTTKGMLLTAREGNYAVGAFNANNLEMAKGIIEAAEEENAPVIVQISQGGAEHAGIEEITAVVKVLARRAEVPVAIHLDHGLTYAWNIKALR
ncbi:MAG: class II fructose-bisphosphate aldolase, partial [Halanaerobiales bacterium]